MDNNDLIKTIEYAHSIGKKVHVTLNIFAWDDKYEEIVGALDARGWVHAEDSGAGPNLSGSQTLVGRGSFVPVPAGTRPSAILWS